MSEKASSKDIELVSKAVISGEEGLTEAEKSKFEYALSKRVSVKDVLELMGIYYPEPSEAELSLMTRFIESAGTMKLSKDEAEMLDKMANKRVSMKALTDVVMAAYRNQLATNYYYLKDQLLHLQIIARDKMATNDGIKRLADKLLKNKKIDEETYHTIASAHLKLTKKDFEETKATVEKTKKDLQERMNKLAEELKKQEGSAPIGK